MMSPKQRSVAETPDAATSAMAERAAASPIAISKDASLSIRTVRATKPAPAMLTPEIDCPQ